MISNFLEKVFANKYAIWTDAAVVIGGLIYIAWETWVGGFYSLWLPVDCLAMIPPFLAVILSLKGEVDGWD